MVIESLYYTPNSIHNTMKIHARSFIGALAAVLMLGLSATVRAGELEDAVAQLESAKGDHKVEHLEKAKAHLEEAGRHKMARAEAIHSVDEALGLLRKGDKHRADEVIDRAIHQIREAR